MCAYIVGYSTNKASNYAVIITNLSNKLSSFLFSNENNALGLVDVFRSDSVFMLIAHWKAIDILLEITQA